MVRSSHSDVLVEPQGTCCYDLHSREWATQALGKRGVLVAGTLISAVTIRIEPPLVITYEQIDEVLNRLEDVFKEIYPTLHANYPN